MVWGDLVVQEWRRFFLGSLETYHLLPRGSHRIMLVWGKSGWSEIDFLNESVYAGRYERGKEVLGLDRRKAACILRGW